MVRRWVHRPEAREDPWSAEDRISPHAPQSKTLTRLRGSQAAFPPSILPSPNHPSLLLPACLDCIIVRDHHPTPFNRYDDCTATAPLRFAPCLVPPSRSFSAFFFVEIPILLLHPSFERDLHRQPPLPPHPEPSQLRSRGAGTAASLGLLALPDSNNSLIAASASWATPPPFSRRHNSLAAVIRSHSALRPR